MSDRWFQRVEFSWWQRFIINCLLAGSLPKHVAFIMDGNRRYSKINGITRAESYLMGFEKIGEILDYCEVFRIKVVSVYAFSIENFKRSAEEKEELFQLFDDKMTYLLKNLNNLNEKGIKIKVMGDISLFPPHLTKLMSEVQLRTAHNTDFCFNLCLSYTSREEMTQSIRTVVEGVKEGALRVTDITESLLDRCMYSEDLPPVDLLVRTSGEVRLSDYMLWQSNFAVLQFVKVMWPDFGFMHFVSSLLDYQRQQPRLAEYRAKYGDYLGQMRDWELKSLEEGLSEGTEERQEVFVVELKKKRREMLEEFSKFEVAGA